jgi:hypothetical protein
MNRIKTWQAVAFAVIAVVIAVGMAWRSLAPNEKGAPIPMPYSGPPPAASGGQQGTSPLPPSSFSGAPPVGGNSSVR